MDGCSTASESVAYLLTRVLRFPVGGTRDKGSPDCGFCGFFGSEQTIEYRRANITVAPMMGNLDKFQLFV